MTRYRTRVVMQQAGKDDLEIWWAFVEVESLIVRHTQHRWFTTIAHAHSRIARSSAGPD